MNRENGVRPLLSDEKNVRSPEDSHNQDAQVNSCTRNMLIARWGGLLRWFRRGPPQRAIIGLRIIILLRLATNIEFMGQQ